jgi:hypothetical protein
MMFLSIGNSIFLSLILSLEYPGPPQNTDISTQLKALIKHVPRKKKYIIPFVEN